MDEICPSATPNQASAISMHIPKFIEFYWSYMYRPEMKIRTYCLHINLSKNNEICLLKFPNQIFTISMFRPNLVKIHWYLLKLSFGNKNTDISSKHNVYCRPRWLSWMRRPTGDQEVAGSTLVEVGNILSWRLIMKYFLRSFSPFRWFKKGSFQFLAKECAQYWLTA